MLSPVQLGLDYQTGAKTMSSRCDQRHHRTDQWHYLHATGKQGPTFSGGLRSGVNVIIMSGNRTPQARDRKPVALDKALLKYRAQLLHDLDALK